MFSLASLRSDQWSTCPELVVVFIGIHIEGELRKLGFEVSESYVRDVRKRHHIPLLQCGAPVAGVI